ncbi:hypothetical protein GZH46_01636 [Fragariocoptes setiger]|uniref:Uncharacterized protein n=1 Tax=Fragariocoptes setiger TaxID=1670756 RepID=A0ABQ7S8S7_9ACAR|nr:hypothetical protein GZH46_01636 [Fragariocoptes setiger]
MSSSTTTTINFCKVSFAVLLASLLLIMLPGNSEQNQSEARDLFKRSFSGLGCLGNFDKAKFARLERVCEECYQLYREPDLHSMCRQDCFRNSVFTRCVDALLLTHEQKKLEDMVDELYGR